MDTKRKSPGPLEALYLDQLRRYQLGERFDAQAEAVRAFGLKGGQFGQRIIQELLEEDFENSTKVCRIRRKNQKYYDTDGHIPSLGVHIESKYMTFYSAGTAPEKLPYWLCKLEEYDKPAVLVLGGMHETFTDEPSQLIWSAYHTPSNCHSKVIQACIEAVRDRLVDVVKLSELRAWAKARR